MQTLADKTHPHTGINSLNLHQTHTHTLTHTHRPFIRTTAEARPRHLVLMKVTACTMRRAKTTEDEEKKQKEDDEFFRKFMDYIQKNYRARNVQQTAEMMGERSGTTPSCSPRCDDRRGRGGREGGRDEDEETRTFKSSV